jgi:hypothetical protein
MLCAYIVILYFIYIYKNKMNETESLIPVKVALRIRPPKKHTEKLTEYCVLEEQSQVI